MRVRPSEMLKEFDLLYVEDDPLVREAMTAIMGRHFKSIRVAENGQQGVDMFIDNPAPIVVTDIKMPLMDGTEMARYMKEYNPNVHIIITTAFGESNHFIDAIEAGVDGFLTKPVDKSKLFTKLNNASRSLLALRQQEEMYERMHMLLNYQKNIVMLATDGIIQFANQEALSKLSVSSIDQINDISTMNLLFSQESQAKILEAMPLDSNYWIDGLIILHEEDQLVTIEREGVKEYLQIDIAASEDNRHHIITFNEITDLKNEISKQEHLATHDALTGIYNRSFITSSLEHLIKQQSDSHQNVCLILCDIDYFKQVNDTHGHLVGDKVLIEFTKRVQGAIRSKDLLARWGGEEFLIILQDLTPSAIVLTAEKILDAIACNEFETAGKLTCSFGVSQLHAADTQATVFDRVDKALYDAKENGRNQIVFAEAN